MADKTMFGDVAETSSGKTMFGDAAESVPTGATKTMFGDSSESTPSLSPTGLSPLSRDSMRGPGYRALTAMGANPNALDKVESFAGHLPDPLALVGAPEGVAATALNMGRKAAGVAGGLLTGYATHKTAKELGAMIGFPAAGEAIGDILGAVVGGKVAGAISPEAAAQVENLLKTRGIGAVRNWLYGMVTPAAEAEGGFRVNPSILKKTASGGPAPVEYGSTGRPERVGGAVEPTPPEPVENTTFKKKPGVVTPSGGPSPVEYGTLGRPERVGSAVPDESVPIEDTRFKVNPKTKAKMSFGGPPPPTYGTLGNVPTRSSPPGGSFLLPARGTPEDPIASVAALPVAGSPPSPSQPPGHEAFLNPESSGLQIPQEQNARTRVAQGLAQKFKEQGFSAEMIDTLRTSNPAEYQKFKINAGKLATALGFSKQKVYSASDATIDRAIELLRSNKNYKLPEIPQK